MPSPETPDPASFQIADVSPTDADVTRAEFLAYNGRAETARILLDAVLKQDPDNTVACETLGYIALNEHDTETARKWLTQAVKLGSKSYFANYSYAKIEMNDGKLSDAAAVEVSLKAAIQLNPDFAPAYDRLAHLYRMQHDHLEDAHMLELQAMQLEPANLSYRLHTAYLMLDLKREDDALRILNAAREFAKSDEQTTRIDQAVREVQAVKSGRAEKQQPPSAPTED
jgi:predicted Zn-dependent protease